MINVKIKKKKTSLDYTDTSTVRSSSIATICSEKLRNELGEKVRI